MTPFANVLARIGVGSAKVDTRLEQKVYHQGEMVRGEVVVNGGSIAQNIKDIYMFLVVEVNDHGEFKHFTWDKFRLAKSFRIGAGETRRIDFEFRLPFDLPISGKVFQTYLQTGLDISHAKDPKDSDRIIVKLHPKAHAIVEAIKKLGFLWTTRDNESSERYGSHRPFVMEYEFKPVGSFNERIDELEVAFIEYEGDLGAAMIIDRKQIGLTETPGLGDHLIRFGVTDEEMKRSSLLAEKIRGLIEQHV
ncbi:sporulation-control protein spo0M [Marinithermofilum abyssi]|uniref:Sporulation-control protein spo0M n=1 Tax=Marinithermofilum abyssi TaxID=1571185 RepID=A0A8J2VHM0_9BACL|nr:sporulation protein [Marinithermofilum abyssi]GGE08974.1 sporulation-control protein spo0M [Marinithermofilum abyssi]